MQRITTPGYWSEKITPRAGWFNLGLKQVWRYKDLMFLFVKRDFTTQYKQTVLGPLWHVIQPILTTVMFLVLFTGIAKVGTAPVPPTLFYFAGITIWNYFSACLTATANTFSANAGIFGKVYFPRLVLPLSVVMSNIAKFGIQFALLIILMAYYHFSGKFPIALSVRMLLIPVLIVVMAGISLGVGIIISSLTTKYKDFNVLVSFSVQLLMYVTPVAYPMSYLEHSKYKAIIVCNPLSSLVEGFRYALFGTGTFDIGQFLYSIVFMIVVVFFGMLIFNKVEKTFMDTV